jgi:hypothetical protein
MLGILHVECPPFDGNFVCTLHVRLECYMFQTSDAPL